MMILNGGSSQRALTPEQLQILEWGKLSWEELGKKVKQVGYQEATDILNRAP